MTQTEIKVNKPDEKTITVTCETFVRAETHRTFNNYAKLGAFTILPDDFFNMFDKCGPGMTNYKP